MFEIYLLKKPYYICQFHVSTNNLVVKKRYLIGENYFWSFVDVSNNYISFILQIFFPIFLSSEKETHENNCTFRPFNCPFIECDEKLVASDVVDHVCYRILIYFSCFSIENSDHILEEIGVQLCFLSEKLKCRGCFLTFLVRKTDDHRFLR